MAAGLAPILFVLVVSVKAVQLQIIKGPVNALRITGDSVTLECVTSNRNCDLVEWTKVEGAQSARTVYTNGIGILDSFPGERYSVSSTGGCNLIIRELEVNDSGRFSCVLLVDDSEETRGSILVVIDVTEACRSNVTSNALNQNDGYSFWTVINVPPKSVEPSNVTLYFQNKTVNETETMDNSQPLTVKTRLTGKASRENIRPRVCRASLPPPTQANFDGSTATMDVCTTQQLIVSSMSTINGKEASTEKSNTPERWLSDAPKRRLSEDSGRHLSEDFKRLFSDDSERLLQSVSGSSGRCSSSWIVGIVVPIVAVVCNCRGGWH